MASSNWLVPPDPASGDRHIGKLFRALHVMKNNRDAHLFDKPPDEYKYLFYFVPDLCKRKESRHSKHDICVVCDQQQGLWVATPCGHRLWCHGCMDWVSNIVNPFLITRCILCGRGLSSPISFQDGALPIQDHRENARPSRRSRRHWRKLELDLRFE